MKRLTAGQVTDLIKDRQDGLDRRALAQKYGLTVAGVKSILLKNKVILPIAKRTANALRSKCPEFVPLTQEQTSQILALRATGLKATAIAKSMGRPVQEIRSVCHRNGLVLSSEQRQANQRTATTYTWTCTVAAVDAIPPELDKFLQGLGANKSLAVEYCGLHFHSDRYKARTYHVSKLKDCDRLGIRLVTVFSDEWHERPDVVKSYLASIVGDPRVCKIGARTLACREVAITEARPFLDRYHIQGAAGHLCFGLYQNADLVAVMSFRRSSQSRMGAPDECTWELSRYCVKTETMVVGGFQRLWAAFVRKENPAKVITFADRRWSNGDVYTRAGFVLDKELPPAYWYVKPGSDLYRVHRSAFRKTKIEATLGPLLPSETEAQAMQRFGFARIWDCGYRRFVWRGK